MFGEDELDARDLADLLRMGRLAEAWIAPPEIRELREVTRYRDCGHAFTWTTRPEDHASHVVERRLVEVMPLHAITALYGERGLRERFAAESAKSGDKTGRQQVKQALQLAGRLHAADRRQREPYVNHVLRVRCGSPATTASTTPR